MVFILGISSKSLYLIVSYSFKEEVITKYVYNRSNYHKGSSKISCGKAIF